MPKCEPDVWGFFPPSWNIPQKRRYHLLSGAYEYLLASLFKLFLIANSHWKKIPKSPASQAWLETSWSLRKSWRSVPPETDHNRILGRGGARHWSFLKASQLFLWAARAECLGLSVSALEMTSILANFVYLWTSPLRVSVQGAKKTEVGFCHFSCGHVSSYPPMLRKLASSVTLRCQWLIAIKR